MTALAPLESIKPMVEIRERVKSFIKVAPDKACRDLLRDVLAALDKPYDLEWIRTEYRLRPAEFRVLEYMVEGKSTGDISQITGTQISTVRVHRNNIYRSLGVNSYAELMALLLRRARGI